MGLEAGQACTTPLASAWAKTYHSRTLCRRPSRAEPTIVVHSCLNAVCFWFSKSRVSRTFCLCLKRLGLGLGLLFVPEALG